MKATPITELPEDLTARVRSTITRHVDLADGCHIWTGSRGNSGYGHITFRLDGRRRSMGAHRAAWLCQYGPIPEGLVIDHLCRNPLCVNPDHLEPVTYVENFRRGRKSRSTAGVLPRVPRRGICHRGHEYTADNSYWWFRNSDGQMVRQCRVCRADRAARYHARKRSARLADASIRS